MGLAKKITIIGAILAVAAIVGASIFLGGTGNVTAEKITSNVVTQVSNGEVQEVTLTFKNYKYELQPATLQKDVSVKMIVDMSTVYGCMRDVVIPSFNVRQTVSEGNNVITFTPDKTGTFNIVCSMNMGRGTFNVVDATGSTTGFVEEAPVAAAGSCGSTGGGCGCGGA